MAYTTIKKPSDYFRVKTYEGSYTDNNTVTWDETDTNFGSNLFLWLKNRDLVQEHWLTDSVRGATKFLESNSTNAEVDAGGNFAYTTNGFVLDNNARTNRESMVGWGWNTSGSATSNTDGSITSTVSANTTSGFSIVSYTGTGSPGTVGHGLGTTPSMIIVKDRTTAGEYWHVYHKSLGATKSIYLNVTDAAVTTNGSWNNTEPTSTVFSIGTVIDTSSANLIAYCFAEKQGFSKFGSYIGNGSTDGTFVYTGFKPAFVIIKNMDVAQDWYMLDNKRDTSNLMDIYLRANESGAEATFDFVDFLSNGFKCKNSASAVNSANTFIYMAFAEEPLVGDNPCTAR